MMTYYHNIQFAYHWVFWFLLIIPVLTAFYIFKYRSLTSEVIMPSPWSGKKNPFTSYKTILHHAFFGIRMLVLGLLIAILARPQSSVSWKNVTKEGIDIVIALDISGSMLSKDFSPSRVEAAKKVAAKFIDSRPEDNIGLVIFSRYAMTVSPLTTAHSVIKNLFEDIRIDKPSLRPIDDGTAIGDGLATAVNRLNGDNNKSKVVILLTDGVNNAGSVAPLTAAEIAKVYGIRVYTIGVGTMGKAYGPDGQIGDQYTYSYQPVEIDENLLNQIASETGGKYFRATDNESLQKIYTEIDKMEKSKIEVKNFTERPEEFLPLAEVAGILLLLELIFRNTLLRTIP
jgi:Ca-activated chloride channel family protein